LRVHVGDQSGAVEAGRAGAAPGVGDAEVACGDRRGARMRGRGNGQDGWGGGRGRRRSREGHRRGRSSRDGWRGGEGLRGGGRCGQCGCRCGCERVGGGALPRECDSAGDPHARLHGEAAFTRGLLRLEGADVLMDRGKKCSLGGEVALDRLPARRQPRDRRGTSAALPLEQCLACRGRKSRIGTEIRVFAPYRPCPRVRTRGVIEFVHPTRREAALEASRG